MVSYNYRFLDLYYILNYLVIASYTFVRSALITPESPLVSREKSWVGLTREAEMIIVMLIIQGRKLFTSGSIDSSIQSLLFSLKMLVVSFVFQLNRAWALVYLIVYLLMYVIVQPPRYNGPTNVINYSESIFRSIVLEDRTSSRFVVMFDARWATGIEYVRALFAELSLQFANERTTFIHLDLSRSPTLAKELKINIDGYAGEIPTFIVFQKGKEIVRAPCLSEKPRLRAFHWTKENTCDVLGLSVDK